MSLAVATAQEVFENPETACWLLHASSCRDKHKAIYFHETENYICSCHCKTYRRTFAVFYCTYPASFKRDGREVVCMRKGFGAGTGGCVGTAVAPDAICHTSAGLLLSGSSQQDAGTPLWPVPRAGGGARMFWRKYSTTEAVTAGNASGGTVFAFRGSLLPCKHSRDARVKGCIQERLQDNLGEARKKASPQSCMKFSVHELGIALATEGRNLEKWSRR